MCSAASKVLVTLGRIRETHRLRLPGAKTSSSLLGFVVRQAVFLKELRTLVLGGVWGGT